MPQCTAIPWSSESNPPSLGDWFEPPDGTIGLSELWDLLCSRRVRSLTSFFTERDCCSVLELAPPTKPFGRPLGQRELRILERVLFGYHQKVIAMELDRSSSTISEALRKTLARFGFDGGGGKLPILVLMAAQAARVGSAERVPLRSVQLDGCPRQAVFAARPDSEFGVLLSAAEIQVARLLLEGLSYAEIAERRGTSSRTVANQVAALFRKLRVSGRTEFLLHLIQRSARFGVSATD